MEPAVIEVDLVPAEIDRFAGAESVAVHHGDEEPIAEAMPADFFGCVFEALDFFGGQVLARADVGVPGFGRRTGCLFR